MEHFEKMSTDSLSNATPRTSHNFIAVVEPSNGSIGVLRHFIK